MNYYVQYDGVTGDIVSVIGGTREPDFPYQLVFADYPDVTGKKVDLVNLVLIDF